VFHQEEMWKYDLQRSIFDKIWGVWIADEILSWVCDISSQSKQKLRSKWRSKIVKIYAYSVLRPGIQTSITVVIFFVFIWWIILINMSRENNNRDSCIDRENFFFACGSSKKLFCLWPLQAGRWIALISLRSSSQLFIAYKNSVSFLFFFCGIICGPQFGHHFQFRIICGSFRWSFLVLYRFHFVLILGERAFIKLFYLFFSRTSALFWLMLLKITISMVQVTKAGMEQKLYAS